MLFSNSSNNTIQFPPDLPSNNSSIPMTSISIALVSKYVADNYDIEHYSVAKLSSSKTKRELWQSMKEKGGQWLHNH